MKKLIDWFLGLFKKPQEEVVFEAWPFPAVSEDFNPRPCECEKPKKKRTVKKATTRPKKPAVIAKKVAAKKRTQKAK